MHLVRRTGIALVCMAFATVGCSKPPGAGKASTPDAPRSRPAGQLAGTDGDRVTLPKGATIGDLHRGVAKRIFAAGLSGDCAMVWGTQGQPSERTPRIVLSVEGQEPPLVARLVCGKEAIADPATFGSDEAVGFTMVSFRDGRLYGSHPSNVATRTEITPEAGGPRPGILLFSVDDETQSAATVFAKARDVLSAAATYVAWAIPATPGAPPSREPGAVTAAEPPVTPAAVAEGCGGTRLETLASTITAAVEQPNEQVRVGVLLAALERPDGVAFASYLDDPTGSAKTDRHGARKESRLLCGGEALDKVLARALDQANVFGIACSCPQSGSGAGSAQRLECRIEGGHDAPQVTLAFTAPPSEAATTGVLRSIVEVQEGAMQERWIRRARAYTSREIRRLAESRCP